MPYMVGYRKGDLLMGMYDNVNVKIPCQKCGYMINDFQSKDARCMMERIDPMFVSEFYSSCRKCGTWSEFSRPQELLEENNPREDPYSLEEVLEMGFTLSKKENN